MQEVWKNIPSQPELMASSYGRIKVKPHVIAMPHGGMRIYGGTPTYGQCDGKRMVYARKGHKTLKVHALVCEAFHGPKKQINLVCMHMDENGINNIASNLAWGTQKRNLNFPGFLAYCRSRTGENSPTVKHKLAMAL